LRPVVRIQEYHIDSGRIVEGAFRQREQIDVAKQRFGGWIGSDVDLTCITSVIGIATNPRSSVTESLVA
jgi:hypothetical protein